MKKYALWISASVLALSVGGIAAAQPASPPPDEGTPKADKVEKVVVTAERRSTALQRTPISVTVITGEQLENKGVTNVDSLQFVSPGTTVNNFGQGIDFNIRGIGKAEHNTQTTTGVITYRDGVAGFPGYFTAEPYYDIARVEILRGPQGTFVGQNATGGAVFVTSNNPIIDGEYHGYIAGQVGNYNDFAAQGAMNVPISDDFAARIAFNGEMRDSFYDLTGPYTGDDGVKMLSGRISLLWQPTTQFSALFKTDYNHLDFSSYPSVEALARRGSTATGVTPILANRDLFEFSLNADMYARDKFGRSSLKLDYVFGDGTTVRSITGYQWGNSAYKTDLDGRTTTPYPTEPTNWTFRDSVDEFLWSEEVNIISADDAWLRWILGAYFQDDLHDFLTGEFVIGVPPGSIFTEYRLDGINRVQNRAVFGQLGFNIFEDLELQIGARYSNSWTKNEGFISQYGLPLTMRQSEKYNGTSGKVSLNWIVDEHNFLYGFAATGFKPGGLNVDVGLGPPAPFKSEKVTNYELGWKSGWFDGQLRTQMDVYYNDYDNFQVIIGYPQFPTFGFELNVPNTSRVYGFEAQAEAIFGQFSMDMGLGWMHSELGEFWAVDTRNAPPAAVAGVSQCDPRLGPISSFPAFPALAAGMVPYCHNLEGQDQTYAPEFSFNLGAQYVFDLGDGMTLTPRFNYGHVSKQWATLFEDASRGDRIEDRNIINAQIAWSNGEWVATLYSTNLTDQHYAAALNSNMYFAGPPRQFGIRVMKVF